MGTNVLLHLKAAEEYYQNTWVDDLGTMAQTKRKKSPPLGGKENKEEKHTVINRHLQDPNTNCTSSVTKNHKKTSIIHKETPSQMEVDDTYLSGRRIKHKKCTCY